MNRITKLWFELLERSRSQIEEPKLHLVAQRDEMATFSGPYKGKDDWKLIVVICIILLLLIGTTTSLEYLWSVRPR